VSSRTIIQKRKRRLRRKLGVRKKLFGTETRPRLSVFRSSKHIYAQLVDDMNGRTLASASTACKELRSAIPHGGNVAAAKAVGEKLAERALAAGIKSVIFDRNGFKYHGRLQALADAAREKGLEF